MKGTRKSRHTRTSKRGRKFLAGRGVKRGKRISIRKIEIMPSGKYPEIQWAPKKIKRDYSMGYFENPKERERIAMKRNQKRIQAVMEGHSAEWQNRKIDKRDVIVGEHIGYDNALKDLGLLKNFNVITKRYGRPERRRQ